ncbi:MAG TPA: CsbD family protein [Bradyrhizobium sp.]|nr:CsbD family protein [Bradyrhizobium sp.]
MKGTTDKIAGKTKEAVAEIIGDGKLREEGKAQQRKAKRETNEPGEPNPLRPLDKLT